MAAQASHTAQAQAPQQYLLTPDTFLQQTKAKSSKIVSAFAYVDGGTQQFQLPQTGLAHCVWVQIQSSFVLGGTSVTSGTWQSYPNPVPFSIVRRIRFGNNNSLNMRDLSGWSWYKWVRYRYGIDPLSTDSNAKFSANGQAFMNINQGTTPVAGANVALGTFNFSLTLPLPISFNEAGDTGLLVLQQNSTFYYLTVQWGQMTGGMGPTGGTNDIFNTLVGVGLTYASTTTITAGLDWFEPIPGIDNLISMFMSVFDQTQAPLVTGADTVMRVPVNDYYTFLMLEIINNGAPLSVVNIQNPTFQHSGNVYDYQDDYAVKLMRSYFQHRLPPMDGTLDWDLGLRRGIIGRRDTYDAFDNLNVTDVQLRFTVPGSVTPTGINQVSALFECLRYVQR